MRLPKYPQYAIARGKYTVCPSISDSMCLKRLELLKRCFHLNDVFISTPDFNVYCKGRPILHSLLTKYGSIQQRSMSIDEQGIPTKSKSLIFQQMTMKPHKWGIKGSSQCGVS